MTDTQMDLEHLRSSVDAIDEQIVDLLNTRALLAIKMGQVKNSMNLPLQDLNRESDVRANLQRLCAGHALNQSDLNSIYESIMKACLRVQQTADCDASCPEL